MAVAGRLTIVLVIAVSAGIVATAWICHNAGKRIDIALEAARVSHLLGTLHGTAETNLGIGLALDQLSTMQPQIERERAADPTVLAIDVFTAGGRPLYSTDSGALDEPVPERWTQHLEAGGVWRLDRRDETVFGLGFEDNIGEAAGGVAVTVSDDLRSARLRDRAITQGVTLLLLAVLACAAATVAARFFARRITADFRQVTRILRGGNAATATPTVPAAVRVQAHWQRREAAIAQAMEQLEAMDDLG